ncbi:VCBS domain-containing protein [Roseibium denhamense]|uniref:VCBS repeat-containing protein n=1 Tax=Roseibium denhamense TaxID=76305 RepID=A0ABY1PIK9_9HYPH|nr:VCBS domain-containing protein [Roseibium denhamense]SMP34531.1 VCBS repeat-containing protein [Roseibium denhamense]
MSDQTDKSKPRAPDKDVLPEEAKDTKKTQSEEGFGWSIEAEGSDSNPVSPQTEPGGDSQDRDPHPVPGPTSIPDHGLQETSAPPQGPLSPPDLEAPSASHGLAGATETGPAPVADIPANAAPPPDVETLSSAGHPGATARTPTGTHTPPPSAAGSEPSPDSGNTTQPQSGVIPTAVGGHAPPTSTGTTPTPGGGHTPPTSTGGTPPPGGTQTPPSSTGTTPTPGGGHTPPATTAARISGLDTGTAREDHHVVGSKLSAGGLLTVSDPDAGEDKFQAVAGAPGSAGYGSFTVAENGRWTYSADNSQAVIQALRPGISLVDRVTVHSADGTAHELRVVITGTNDTPVLSAATASATEDGSSVKGQMSATDVDAGDTKAYSIGQPVDGFTMHADGSWSFDPSHAAYQHLAAGQTQQVTIPVTVTDSAGARDTENLVITVTGTNDAPVLRGPVDLGSGTEDKSVPISTAQLLAHATDIDTGDQLSVTSLAASHGTITGDAAHGFTFTPDPNYNGPVTLSYQVTDGHGGHVPQTASLTLGATPDAAVITGTDTGSATEDKVSSSNRLVVSGSLNVSDPDGPSQEHFQYNSFGEHAVSDPFGGSLHIDRSGNWGYEVDNTHPAVQSLAAGQEGHAVYEVHSSDGTAHQIRITIHGTNDVPVLSAASASATEDGSAVTGQMSATDVDTGDTKAFSVGQPVDGFSMNADGSWSFDPSHAAYQHLAAGQTQQVTIPVTVTDSAGGTDTENLVITVTGTGDAAVIGGVDTGSVTENAAGQNMSPDYAQPGMAKLGDVPLYADGKLTIADPDAGENAFDTHGQGIGYHGTYGDLNLKADGTWHYYGDAGSRAGLGGHPTTRGTVIDQLGEGQSLTDTITVYSKDGTAHDIVITIHGSNDRPYCSSEVQLASGTEDVAQTLTLKQLLANTVDVDANDAGKLSIAGLKVDHGSVRDNQDGTFTFTPEKDYNGQVHFTYDVTDAHGGLTHTGATTTLAAAKDAAVIGGMDTGSVAEWTAGQNMSPDYAQPGMSTLGKATLDASGHLSITDPDAGEASFDTHGLGFTYHGTYGDLLLRANGEWFYHADAGSNRFVGGAATTRGTTIDRLGEGESLTDTITVYSKDGTAHDIVITIHGSNDRPYCSSEVQLASGTEDVAQTLTLKQLLANTVDVDANDAGKLAIAGLKVDHGSVRDNQDGTFTFTPEKDYNGQVHFTYEVKDAHGGLTHTGATTTLAAARDAAVITGTDTGDVTEDRNVWPSSAHPLAVSGSLSVHDPDGTAWDHFQYNRFGEHAVSDPFGGSLHIDRSGNWGYEVDNSHPAIQALAAGQEGHAIYEVHSADGTAHRIQITIHGTNDAPVLSAATASATEDGSAVTGQMSATDVDTGDTKAFSVSQPVDGFTMNADGSWSFDPSHAAYQHLAAGQPEQLTIPVIVTDSTGATDTENLVITVRGTNDGPAVTGPVDLGSGTEDKAVAITAAQLLAHASDIDTGDTLSVTGLSASHGTITGNAAQGFTFTPDQDYNGPVTLSYQVTDGHGGSVAQSASLTLGATPDAAVITGTDTGDVTEDRNVWPSSAHPLAVGGSLSVHDPDGTAWDHFQYNRFGEHAISDPFGGSLHIDRVGNWGYEVDNTHPAVQALAAGQEGHAIYEVHSADGTAHRIQITIHGTNDAPVLSAATASATEDGSTVTGQMSATDVDTGDTKAFSVSQPVDGFSMNADGSWSFDPTDAAYQHLAAGQTLPLSIPVTVTDSEGATAVADLVITVTGTNDAPTVDPASVDTGQVTEDVTRAPITGTLQGLDPDTGDTITWAVEGSANSPYGMIGIQPGTGMWVYRLDDKRSAVDALHQGETVVDRFTVSGTDASGAKVTHEVAITIHGTNDAPELIATTASTTEDAATVSGTLPGTDVDSGDTLIYAVDGTAPAGFALNTDGTWTFDPSDPTYQSLSAGASQPVQIPVAVTDTTGASTRSTLTITVAGSNDAPQVTGAVALPGGTEDQTQVITPAQLLGRASDIDTGDTLSVAGTPTADHGTFSANTDGTFTFHPAPDYNGPVAISYAVTDGTAPAVPASATLALAAVGDAAVITDTLIPDVTEDRSYINTYGQLQADGHLDITDPDPGEAKFDPNIGPQTYAGMGYDTQMGGHLLLQQNGDFIYYIDNRLAAIQALTGGQTTTDHVTIRSADGTTHQVAITINGTDDAAQIGGVTSQSVTEDSGVSGTGKLETRGALTITDPDAGQAAFTAQTAVAGSNGYGSFSVDAQGNWTYSADNSQAAIQNLGPGQTLTDTLQVTSVDGTTHDIMVTINGAIDEPSVGAIVGTAQSAPGHASAFVAALNTQNSATIQGLTLHGFAAGQAFETSAGELVDLTSATGSVGAGRAGIGVDAPEPAAATAIHQTSASVSNIDSRKVDPTDPSVQQGETMVIEFAGVTRDALITMQSFGGQGDRFTWTAYAPNGTPLDHGDLSATSTTNPSGFVDLKVQTAQPFAYIALHAETPPTVPGGSGPSQFTTNVNVESVRAELVRFTTSLTLQGAIGDTGDPDESVSWRIEGLQQAELSAGTRNADGSWTVTRSEAAGLQVLHSDVQHLTVTAIATDAGTGTTAQSATVPVTVDPAGATYTVITGSPIIRTDEDRVTPVTGDLDIDTSLGTAPTFVSGDTATQYGLFHIDADGQWSFTVDTAKAQELIGLGVREQVTVRTTNGATLDMDIEVKGQNDPGVMVDLAGSNVRGPAAVVGGQLQINDIDDHRPNNMFVPSAGGRPSSSSDIVGQFGTLHLDEDSGVWTYTVDPAQAATIPAGEIRSEDFTALGLQLGGGGRHSLTLRVQVDSSGSAQVLQSLTGQDSGDVTEDQAASGTQDLVATGALSGVVATDPLPTTPIAGTHGTLTTTADGHWTYTADNTDATIQALKTGETLTDEIMVSTSSGQAYRVAITIHGTDDIAQIGGAVSGAVTEDVGPGHHTFPAMISTSGDLTITDADSGEAAFTVQTGVVGTYGTFSVDAAGHWTYEANNQQGAIQQLTGRSTPLTDTFTVTSKDGTQHDVTISIHGTNDAPVAVSQQGNVTEGASKSGHLSVWDVDAGDTHRFTTTATVPGFVLNTDGTYSFDASGTDYQGLKDGELKQIDIPVTITDKAGASDSFTFRWTVTGTNDAPVAKAADLGQTDQGVDKTFTSAELLSLVHAQDVDHDTLTISSVQIDPQFGTISHNAGLDTWTFHPAQGVHQDNLPVQITVSDGTDTTRASAIIDVVQTYTAPHLDVLVDVASGQHVSGGASAGHGGQHGGGYNQYLDQMMQQLQRDHGGRSVTHVHDEVKGSEHNDRVFIFDDMRHEQINMEKGRDFFYLRGTTHEKIEGKEGSDTLILGSYDSHSWHRIPEIKDVENIMTNDGVWVRGGPPHGFDPHYFQASPPAKWHYPIDIDLQSHTQGDTVTRVEITSLPRGSQLLDSGGQAITPDQHGHYVFNVHGGHVPQLTLVSDSQLDPAHDGVGATVITDNVASGMSTTTTIGADGSHHHVTAPIVIHDEPSDGDADLLSVDVVLVDPVDGADSASAPDTAEAPPLHADPEQTDGRISDSDMERPGETDKGPANSGRDHLAAYFDAIGHDPDAAGPSSKQAEHLTVYLEASGADPDQTVHSQDPPDPAVLALDDPHALSGNDAQDTPEDDPDGGQIADVPDPVVQDPNDDTSHFGS